MRINKYLELVKVGDVYHIYFENKHVYTDLEVIQKDTYNHSEFFIIKHKEEIYYYFASLNDLFFLRLSDKRTSLNCKICIDINNNLHSTYLPLITNYGSNHLIVAYGKVIITYDYIKKEFMICNNMHNISKIFSYKEYCVLYCIVDVFVYDRKKNSIKKLDINNYTLYSMIIFYTKHFYYVYIKNKECILVYDSLTNKYICTYNNLFTYIHGEVIKNYLYFDNKCIDIDNNIVYYRNNEKVLKISNGIMYSNDTDLVVKNNLYKIDYV